MKTFIQSLLIPAILFCIADIHAQNIPTYPIPSSGVTVSGYANFIENYHNYSVMQTLAKRKAEVTVTASGGSQNCSVTVWAYSRDMTTTLGPYTAYCEQTLYIDIDDRVWGILIYSTTEVEADVVITEE